MLAAYTVAPRHSTPRCLTYLIWRYKCALQHTHLQEAIAIANKFALRSLLRIFGCAMLAAYTVSPRQSTPRCLPVFYLEIYGCLTAPAVARSHCNCKQVCTPPVSSYIRLRLACRIYCSASAEHSPLPDRILFGDISVPCSTHICEKPLQLQTSLHRAGFFVYSAALSLPHILYRLGRALPVA